MLLKALYNASADDEPELSGNALESARDVASQAFEVLDDWKLVPGSDDDGTIDAAKLLAWVQGACAACAAAHRVQIGEIFVRHEARRRRGLAAGGSPGGTRSGCER